MTVIYFAPLGKGAGEQLRGLMRFLYSITAFSEINKYQRKKKKVELRFQVWLNLYITQGVANLLL